MLGREEYKQHCRDRAAECREQALHAPSDDERLAWLAIAAEWQELADEPDSFRPD